MTGDSRMRGGFLSRAKKKKKQPKKKPKMPRKNGTEAVVLGTGGLPGGGGREKGVTLVQKIYTRKE